MEIVECGEGDSFGIIKAFTGLSAEPILSTPHFSAVWRCTFAAPIVLHFAGFGSWLYDDVHLLSDERVGSDNHSLVLQIG